jgi:hypothetical protein
VDEEPQNLIEVREEKGPVYPLLFWWMKSTI